MTILWSNGTVLHHWMLIGHFTGLLEYLRSLLLAQKHDKYYNWGSFGVFSGPLVTSLPTVSFFDMLHKENTNKNGNVHILCAKKEKKRTIKLKNEKLFHLNFSFGKLLSMLRQFYMVSQYIYCSMCVRETIWGIKEYRTNKIEEGIQFNLLHIRSVFGIIITIKARLCTEKNTHTQTQSESYHSSIMGNNKRESINRWNKRGVSCNDIDVFC